MVEFMYSAWMMSVASVIVLAVLFLHSASADSPGCFPISVDGRCLTDDDDRAIISKPDVEKLGGGETRLHVNVTGIIEGRATGYYIIQIVDQNGYTAYIDIRPVDIIGGVTSNFTDSVKLVQGNYTAKVLMWGWIDPPLAPLYMTPAERTFAV